MLLKVFGLCLLILTNLSSAQELRVGSKGFTENVILGELLTRSLRSFGPVRHRAQLGGTRVLWEALLAGEIDMYPEYTGTLLQEILHQPGATLQELSEQLRAQGVGVSRPLGFNNTYAVAMLRHRAVALGIQSISDLAAHPELNLGFGNEFLSREDGWPALREAYALSPSRVRGFDHDLAYRALQSGQIDVTDAYSTDAEIEVYQLQLLKDNLAHFPRYEAVVVYRLELNQHPGLQAVLERLAGRLNETTMRGLNRKVRVDGISESQAAANWLGPEQASQPADLTRFHRLVKATIEHAGMVTTAVFMATLVGLPLGVLISLYPGPGRGLLALVGLVQTIPSLALLVFLIPLCGLGQATAVVALTLYGLLPVVQGVYTGLNSIPLALRESAQALGLTTAYRWRRIDIPLALPSIVAGIQTSSVIAVGTATLAALIGGGGYGDPILTGVRLARTDLLLEGAVPAALMAIFVQSVFGKIYRAVLLP